MGQPADRGARLRALRLERSALAPSAARFPLTWSLLESELAHLSTVASPSVVSASARRQRVRLRVPAERYPSYNFVGRLLGPRGTTLKRLERETGCRIMIRGRGSIRKDKEAAVRGKPGWEHVFEDVLHVVIEVAAPMPDAAAAALLARARETVALLLVPVPDADDGLKRHQLRVLAILNGTFRQAEAGTPPATPATKAAFKALPMLALPPISFAMTEPGSPRGITRSAAAVLSTGEAVVGASSSDTPPVPRNGRVVPAAFCPTARGFGVIGSAPGSAVSNGSGSGGSGGSAESIGSGVSIGSALSFGSGLSIGDAPAI